MARFALPKRLGALATTPSVLSAGICQATRLEQRRAGSASAPASDNQSVVSNGSSRPCHRELQLPGR